MVSLPLSIKPEKGDLWLLSTDPIFHDEHDVVIGLVTSTRLGIYTIQHIVKKGNKVTADKQIDTFIFLVTFIRLISKEVTWEETRVPLGKNGAIKTDYSIANFNMDDIDAALTIRKLHELKN